jgi:hypothetical protein
VARTKTRSALSVLKEAGLPHGHRAGKWSLPRWEVSRDKLAELAGQLKGTRRADGRGEVEPQLGVGDEVMLPKYGAGSKKSKPR